MKRQIYGKNLQRILEEKQQAKPNVSCFCQCGYTRRPFFCRSRSYRAGSDALRLLRYVLYMTLCTTEGFG